MPLESLKKLPPTIVITGEFDFLRRDALAMVERLKQAGVLLDYWSMAGSDHYMMECLLGNAYPEYLKE